ncbi:hypothetical protein C4D60_Mb05t21120 [Musa balbisiana]|uniref:Uncharacterized protein n=1 Tax=Musa balbisiana TaxID=52838 RepID=A0A4S8JXR6_MUSBA|nr:hypothetical protein C4D60_Mb05t21120 [Musa balbisiana]
MPKVAGSSILLDDAKGVPFLEFLGKRWCALVPLHLFSVQLHVLVDLPTLHSSQLMLFQYFSGLRFIVREASGKFNPWKTDLDVLSIMQGAQDRGATAQDVSSSEYPIPGKQFLF